MKAGQTVNLLDDEFKLVTLRHGDEVPDWAAARFTNEAAICSCDALPAAPIIPESPEGAEVQADKAAADAAGENQSKVNYAELDRKALDALCEERGLSAKGNKPDLVARLEEHDAATSEEEEVDVWSMDATELKALAAKRGVDIGDANGTEEIAALLVQAEVSE